MTNPTPAPLPRPTGPGWWWCRHHDDPEEVRCLYIKMIYDEERFAVDRFFKRYAFSEWTDWVPAPCPYEESKS